MATLMDSNELKQRRAKARRTAILLAITAAAIFAIFILTGVLGR